VKFTADSDALLAALAALPPAPVLGCLRLSAAAGGGLSVYARDDVHGVSAAVAGAEVAEPGVALVPAGKFARVLGELPPGPVAVAADDAGGRLARGPDRFEFPGHPAADYPPPPEFPAAAPAYGLPAAALRRALHLVEHAADKKEANSRSFALAGVRLEPAPPGTLRVVATDSKRMAVCSVDVTTAPPGGPPPAATIPPAAVRLLLKLLADAAGPARLALPPEGAADNLVLVAAGGATLHARLVAGRYPDCPGTLGQARKATRWRVPLPHPGFLRAVRQAAVMTDEETRRIDFAFAPGAVALRARGRAVGSAEVTLSLPGSRAECAVAADPACVVPFLERLDAAAGADLTLELADGGRPLVFAAGAAAVLLVMPLT
jgi:DNA polymerase-3 subunit beta